MKFGIWPLVCWISPKVLLTRLRSESTICCTLFAICRVLQKIFFVKVFGGNLNFDVRLIFSMFWKVVFSKQKMLSKYLWFPHVHFLIRSLQPFETCNLTFGLLNFPKSFIDLSAFRKHNMLCIICYLSCVPKKIFR